MLALDRYASAIRLDEPFAPRPALRGVDDERARDEALEWLLQEHGRTLASVPQGTDAEVLLHRLLTIRHPGGIPSRVLVCLDQALAARARARGAVGPGELCAEPGPILPIGGSAIRIWRGDIKADAAEVAVRTVSRWLREHPGALDLVVFNVFSESDLDAYRTVMGAASEGREP